MSRMIDTTQPLTDEDEKYLRDRDRTVEQEREHQDFGRRVADTTAGDADSLAARIEYARRTGQTSPHTTAPVYVRKTGVNG